MRPAEDTRSVSGRGGFPVRVTPGFCLLLAWFAAVHGWGPLLLILGAAAFHEGGHLLALHLCGRAGGRRNDGTDGGTGGRTGGGTGGRMGGGTGGSRGGKTYKRTEGTETRRRMVRGLRLSVQGAALDIDRSRLSYGRELLCVLAGPAANLLLALLAARLAWNALCGASLLLCLYNLLPVRPLDGGQAVELALSRAAGPRAGEGAARLCGVLGGGLLAGGTAWLVARSGGNLWLLPPLAGFLSAAVRELRGCPACGKKFFAKPP